MSSSCSFLKSPSIRWPRPGGPASTRRTNQCLFLTRADSLSLSLQETNVRTLKITYSACGAHSVFFHELYQSGHSLLCLRKPLQSLTYDRSLASICWGSMSYFSWVIASFLKSRFASDSFDTPSKLLHEDLPTRCLINTKWVTKQSVSLAISDKSSLLENEWKVNWKISH